VGVTHELILKVDEPIGKIQRLHGTRLVRYARSRLLLLLGATDLLVPLQPVSQRLYFADTLLGVSGLRPRT